MAEDYDLDGLYEGEGDWKAILQEIDNEIECDDSFSEISEGD